MAEKRSSIMGSAMITAVMLLNIDVICTGNRAYTVRAINATIRPIGSSIGAITHIRDNDTFSRPPTDLRGSSCSMRSLLKGQGYRYYGAMMPSQRQLKISPLSECVANMTHKEY